MSLQPVPAPTTPVGTSRASAVLVAVAVLLAAVALAVAPRGPAGPHLAFWIAACLGGEALWVRLPLGRTTLSMASAVNFAALLTLSPAHAMAVTGVASLIGERTFMRKRWLRCAFNAAQTVLAAGAAVWTLAALGGVGDDPDSLLATSAIPALLGAAVAYTIVNYGAVSVAVAVAERVSPLAAWRANYGSIYELVSSGALFSLGIVFATMDRMTGPAGTVVVALPLVLAWASYKKFLVADRREEAAEEEPRKAA